MTRPISRTFIRSWSATCQYILSENCLPLLHAILFPTIADVGIVQDHRSISVRYDTQHNTGHTYNERLNGYRASFVATCRALSILRIFVKTTSRLLIPLSYRTPKVNSTTLYIQHHNTKQQKMTPWHPQTSRRTSSSTRPSASRRPRRTSPG